MKGDISLLKFLSLHSIQEIMKVHVVPLDSKSHFCIENLKITYASNPAG